MNRSMNKSLESQQSKQDSEQSISSERNGHANGRADDRAKGRANPPGQMSKFSTLLYLAAIYTGLQCFLWIALNGKNTPLAIISVIAILAIMIIDPIRRGETITSLGLDRRSLMRALRLIAIPMLLAVLGVVSLIVWQPLCLPLAPALLKKFVAIIPWALFQQGLLQGTFNKRLCDAFGKGWHTATITAVCFAFMHLPGAILTAMTFVGGLVWSRYYQRTSDLWTIVLTHALVSSLLQAFLPPDLTHGFRVGPGYYRY